MIEGAVEMMVCFTHEVLKDQKKERKINCSATKVNSQDKRAGRKKATN